MTWKLFNITNKSKDLYFNTLGIVTAFFLLTNCGTVYVPQILPEARGVGKSVGQEDIAVTIVPLTTNSLKQANQHPYIRRVIEASNLSKPARLVSVKQAINQFLPPETKPQRYRLGPGDELLITQLLTLEDTSENTSDDTSGIAEKTIATRELKIADDGFVSILGVGRLPVAGLTQFEAEDLIYKALVGNQISPEFELRISGFLSKKSYIYNLEQPGNTTPDEGSLKVIPFTNIPVFLHEALAELTIKMVKGQDSLVILKRDKELYRMSLKSIIDGSIPNIRLLPEDRISIESLPYRPEKAIIVGEVATEQLFSISADFRQSLAEALYGAGPVFISESSDTSQIFVIREKQDKNIVAYHLDSSNPARLTLAAKFELRPNDIIYVAPQFVTNYNRALVQIFSAYSMTTSIN